IENLDNIFNDSENLNEEKEEQNKGNYKRADLLKMHAYRDAIRRTAGAYVLYPGSKTEKITGFHEIIPGLGAFAISPSKQSDGTTELKIFLQEIVQHFLNRASQREQISLKTYQTFKQKPDSEVKEALPETYGENRSLLPDETTVLIAYYKNQEHLEWILKNSLYNARVGKSKGSLRLEASVTDARYLLLHGKGELLTGKLFKLKKGGPRIFSKEEITDMKYPDPNHNFYLMFDLEGDAEVEFKKYEWNISLLEKHGKGRDSALPYSVTLTELMKAKL
ncbi:MAG TPA: nuclease domain-containing protein, partial [Cyclobacteriaceae bacterium]|nr:nuclease domain-containing protein [Cyclobacteriaceae bacterium]